MITCNFCGRGNLTAKEYSLHIQYCPAIKKQELVKENIAKGICPECGSGLAKQEGCSTCNACGFSLCG